MNGRLRPAIAAFAADAACVVAFVSLGRRNHDEEASLDGLLTTAAPFLVALVVSWLAARAWRRPLHAATGAVVVAITVLVGMILRRFVWDRGIATSFVIVTVLVLAALVIGWRLVALAVRRRTAGDLRRSS